MLIRHLLFLPSFMLLACRPGSSPSVLSTANGSSMTCSLESASTSLPIGGTTRKNVISSVRHQLTRSSCVPSTNIFVKTAQSLRSLCAKAQDCEATDPLGTAEVSKILVESVATLGPDSVIQEEDFIMDQKLSDNLGSNPGGFYSGRDGVVRYVKTPNDDLQSVTEHLANTIYADLGIPAVKSTLFVGKARTPDGNPRLYYASEMVEGLKDIHRVNNLDTTREFLRGFVADVLLANRDIVSSSGNTAVSPNGQVIRIDSGSALMMRAMGSRKDPRDLFELKEWKGLQDKCINPAYASIVNHAGYTKDELCSEFKRQISAIVAFSKSKNGWKTYVDQAVPAFKVYFPQEFGTSVSMLEQREVELKKLIAAQCR